MSLFHINTCSLTKNIEEIQYLLGKTRIDVDVIGTSELRTKKNKSPINSINLKDYSYLSLYISNHFSYKPRYDLCIYTSTELMPALKF